MERFQNIMWTICFTFFSLVVMLAVISTVNDSGLFDEQQHQKKQTEEYEQFKKDTEVIKGEVVESEIQKRWFFSDKYNLIIKANNDETKMLKVTEQQYRDYQKGSEINVRINTTKKNEIIIDLKKDKDVNTVKDYMKFNDSEYIFE
ncbi:hypothetical protein BU104_12675 [Staphylococcus xylosus]|uniref:Uncharacterized protein n=1 Tax=Staphylococcus xylosus TaxID=1288 RepID=A0AAQ0RWX9_STAXY|nr:hypothetical protein [Staphylococcus xylosus]RIM90980.1 hypothetical protein BU104_12675 [Staphylococcus xylosus]